MMNNNNITIGILIGYLIITIGVANFILLKKKKTSDSFLIAGRTLPTLLVIAVVLGDWLGGGTSIGVCQRGYNEGIAGILYPISIGFGLFIFAVTMSRKYRQSGVVTVPELTEKYFDIRTRLTSAIIIGGAYFVIGVTQIISGGAMYTRLFGIDKWLGDLIAALTFMGIACFGGLRSVAVVNILQCMIIYIGTLLGVMFSLRSIGGSFFGGFNRLFTELPSSFWHFESVNPITLSGEVMAVVLSCFVAQAAISGVFAAKDHKTAIRGTLFAGILLIPIGIMFLLIGLCARIHFAEVLPRGLTASPAMMLSLHPVVAGLSLCGLFAAIISTGPLSFLAPAQIFIQDVYKTKINRTASDKRMLLMSRLVTFILIFGGWVSSVMLYDVLKTILWAFALRSGIAIILIAGSYMGTRYICESGAFWGLIAGFVVIIFWTALGSPYGIHVVMPTSLSIFMAALLLTRLKKRRAEKLRWPINNKS